MATTQSCSLTSFALQAEQFAEILLARLAALGREDRIRIVEAAVVELHFEFFVIGIDEVFLQAAPALLRLQFGGIAFDAGVVHRTPP